MFFQPARPHLHEVADKFEILGTDAAPLTEFLREFFNGTLDVGKVELRRDAV